jgi:hypothetical protein
MIPLDMGFSDTTLCVGQQIMLSAGNPGVAYSWQSDAGFSAASRDVTLGKDGNYTITVTNGAGCTAKAAFALHTSLTALTADFLVSTYGTVGDTVVIVDVSRPRPASLQWALPEGGKDAGSSADGSIRQLTFAKTGTYDISLLARLGECAADIRKSITIMARQEQGRVDSLLGYRESLIKDIVISPNPNSGQFKVAIKLSKASDAQVKLIYFSNGQLADTKRLSGADHYEVPFSAESLPQGVYLIGIEVGKEYVVKKIIKM